MKKILYIAIALLTCLACNKYDDTEIWEKLNDHEKRIKELETLCSQMNTTIGSMQKILNALQDNDYVTSVAKIIEDSQEIGYTINFSKSGSVTIYHGKDGADGMDGNDGTDGHTPVIGVRQDTDGIYYWTLDGEWMLDGNGDKIRATGIDGEKGENGITPKLKIDAEYWYVSYDNGKTWVKLSKATGEDGAEGKDGDSFFQSVDSSDPNHVILTLADGTTIKIPTWKAFEALQSLVNQINTNLDALQTVVSVLQNNDYVTSVTKIHENGKEIGYTINFSKSGSVTIYHGKDGADGMDGNDGADGHTPVIGVRQDTDGIYYWTLDGEWMLDGNGDKIRATAVDGEKGENGITPKLKIDAEYWYVSYDNGKTWVKLSKATGEDGAEGKDGDSFFQSVDSSDPNHVILTLADGTTIKIPTWKAFEALQSLVNKINTNLDALQTVVSVLQNNDYVTSVTKIHENGKEIGYTINFSKSGSVTIYHGKDGADGHTPVIGVRQDTDGIYYWTLDGEWMLDGNGDKIRSTAVDGEKGENGITPKLKIDAEYWYVSYDNGKTWLKLSKATGEDGAEGKDGDSFFQSVDSSDPNHVILTLADGTTLKIPTWKAFEELQSLVNQTNTNLAGIQAIVTALQNSDYVTRVTPVMANGKEIGYVIEFSKSLPITIYHGKDGADGKDGMDGHAPCISVKQDTDGIYYWTLDGEWMKNEAGNKVPATVIPLLRITDGYWEVSYDKGSTWSRIGKATGENGQPGVPGTNGDSFFKSVTQDKNGIYLTLSDGTLITIPTKDNAHNYWAGKKFIINGDSIAYGSGLSSVYDGFSYLVADHFGMSITNYAIGGTVIARRAKDYDECYTSQKEWESDMKAGLLDTKKKYLVNTGTGAPRIYRIYSYNGSKWVAGGNSSDAAGRMPLSDRVREMDKDADVIMIMAGSNDFYYNWTPFGDFESGKFRNNHEKINPSVNVLNSANVSLVHKGAPSTSSPSLDFSYEAYFTYCNIPVVGGCSIKVPYGRRGWWLDKDGKGISTKNFTSEATDFTVIAPSNAAYLTVCFKYEEISPEDCVVYMSAPSEENASNETFCDGLHKLCRYLCETYNGKDIIFLTPIKRKQPAGTGSGTWDCIYPEDTNAEGKTLKDYRDAIIEACEYYSIPYIDMYTLSGLNPHIDSSLFADTDGRAVHPNEEGHRIMASVIIGQMQSMKQ